MKSFVLTLLSSILVFQFAAHAQVGSPALASTVDSLKRLVDAHPKEDTTKVIILNTLARFCFYNLQYKRGIIITKEARRLAQKINYRKGEGLYLRALAVLNTGTPLSFYFDIQTRWFYERIHEKEATNMFEMYNWSYVDWEKASKQLFIALNFAQIQKDKELTGMLLQLIRGMHADLEKYDESLVYADQAIEQFQEINQPDLAFYMLASKMIALEELKRLKEAKVVEVELIRILTQKQDFRKKALLCYRLGIVYANQSKYALELEYLFRANFLLEQAGDTQLRAEVLSTIGFEFNALMMYRKAGDYYAQAVPLLEEIKNYPFTAINILSYLSFITIKLKQFKEANRYIKQCKQIGNKWDYNNDFFNHESKGEILMYQGHPKEAIAQFRLSNAAYKAKFNRQEDHPFTNLYIGQCYLAMGNYKESIIYGEKAYAGSFTFNRQELPIKASLLLTEAYEKSGQPMKACEYLKKHRAIIKAYEEQDLVGRSSTAEIEGIIHKGEQEKAALEREKLIKEAENQNQRWWLITAGGILTSVFVLLLVLYQNNRQKQQANTLLNRQKEEIDYQRTKAENALTDLKATQTQLIQKEKLASLGELTAGIAHEIQNPLNFVNNFSEVSTDLVDELKEEVLAGHTGDALTIAEDLAKNLQKINHHGSRASSIVKGMLEHSRTGIGERQTTDLNALTDEYLRLAYHGLIAKDKNGSTNRFNCELVTDFDPALGTVDVVPQEIGRVLLNLYNNAFYAVSEGQKQQSTDYKPTIRVSTKRLDNQVEIRVKDNGTGIPESIKAKIFQPFFTTKPTGEGTGLGLSLSYDIVTKGHGGILNVNSNEDGGTEFTIILYA